MKKSIKFFAAALAIVAAVSCTKEVFDDAKAPVAAGDGFTFTASIGTESASTKLAVAADGKCTWTAGDIIIVYNGNNSENVTYNYTSKAFVSDNIQTITLTDEMISADKKTVTISTTLDAPTAGKWYFYAVNSVSNLYMIRSNGNAISSSLDRTSQSVVPFTASASCSADGTTIQFKHALAYLKMTSSSWLFAAVVRSNNSNKSDAIVKALDIYPSDGHTVVRADEKANEYVANANEVAVNSPFYVAISPFTWSDGISVDLYYDKDDFRAHFEQRTPDKTVTSTKSFTAVAGHVYDMGNIFADHTSYPTYYESWEAGQDIYIDGVKYNKSTYGAGTLISSDATAFDITGSGGVYFIDSDATLTVGGNWTNRVSKKTIIIGNQKGTKGKVNVGAGGPVIVQSAASVLALKNVEFSSDYGFAFQLMGNMDMVAFDNCSISAQKLCVIASDLNINSVSVVNCDWMHELTDNYVVRGLNKTFDIANFRFNNNVVYSKTATTNAAMNIDIDNTTTATAQNVSFVNNTFVNVRPYNNVAYVYIVNDYALQCSGNLVYFDNGAQPGNWSLSRRCNNDDNVTTNGTFSNNANFVVNPNGKIVCASWAPRVATTTLSASPFSSMDYAAGLFVNTTDYGAKR